LKSKPPAAASPRADRHACHRRRSATGCATPIPPDLETTLAGQRQAVERRAKYLLFRFETGSLLVHLGMSGSLRIVPAGQRPKTRPPGHRFGPPPCACATRGASGWCCGSRRPPHPLLAQLGIEPCPTASTALAAAGQRGRKTPVKLFLMDGPRWWASATSTPPKACSAPASTRHPVGELGRAAAPASPPASAKPSRRLGCRRQHLRTSSAATARRAISSSSICLWTRRRTLPPVRHPDPQTHHGAAGHLYCPRCQH
jgi:hypothetical protein